jgi:hypothetical protein
MINVNGNQEIKETQKTAVIAQRIYFGCAKSKVQVNPRTQRNMYHTLYHRITSKLYTLETRCVSDI